MQSFPGIPASRGIAIGPAFIFRRAELTYDRHLISDRAAEWQRFLAAQDQARAQIQQVYERALEESGSEQAGIFQAQVYMLDDPELVAAVQAAIETQGLNAEAALMDAAQVYADVLAALPDETLSARAADVLDVAHCTLRALLGADDSPTRGLETPSIIVAGDLTPSDTVLIDKTLTLGFLIARGSATSHTAILARGLGLPAVAGAGESVLSIPAGTGVILDGGSGLALADPDLDTLAEYHNRRDLARQALGAAMRQADRPAVTRDGKLKEVAANIGSVESAALALENGADGVGLLRTEFLYLERNTLPDEEEQYAAYRAILEHFGRRPVVLRTLDIGGDKQLPYLPLAEEMNPFLGQRALRLCLARPELFKPQLRAALRAGLGHNLKIMFPMVAILAELRAAKAVLEECRGELRAEGRPFAENIEIGIMVEIPAAALGAEALAREADFFSIGTNDLAQYTMAADRTNPAVAALGSAFHPAVLRLVKMVIDAGHAAGRWVGMCGELAGEPLAAPILVGLGLDEFSAAAPAVPAIKQIIRELDSREMSALAAEALALDSADAVLALVRERVPAANIDV